MRRPETQMPRLRSGTAAAGRTPGNPQVGPRRGCAQQGCGRSEHVAACTFASVRHAGVSSQRWHEAAGTGLKAGDTRGARTGERGPFSPNPPVDPRRRLSPLLLGADTPGLTDTHTGSESGRVRTVWEEAGSERAHTCLPGSSGSCGHPPGAAWRGRDTEQGDRTGSRKRPTITGQLTLEKGAGELAWEGQALPHAVPGHTDRHIGAEGEGGRRRKTERGTKKEK